MTGSLNRIYIPLCFYFIPRGIDQAGVGILIYIPLCFYFIGRSKTGKRWRIKIYIPLCFYFIIDPKHFSGVLHSYLHSTMLLLYRLTENIWIFGDANLHSTMLLLYRATQNSTSQYTIYLHSTMLLLYQSGGPGWWAADPIYIPLCFYFIPFDKIIRNPLSVFTFHYASTLSEYAPRLRVILPYLHSTMLLLYPSDCSCKGSWNWKFTFHYASTLSGRQTGRAGHLASEFTFHYASTLSVPGNRDRQWPAEFTFHYASTLSQPLRSFCFLLCIYIPLCFYFIAPHPGS